MPIAKINGLHIHYHIHGKGIPIVFIHPPLLTSTNFRYQQVQLSGEFQIVTFDIRGHGFSDSSEAPVTYPLIVEDVKQLMDVLAIKKAYICGYSTGGSIALEAMLTYPDRFLGGIVVSGMSEVSNWRLKQRIRLAVLLSRLRAKWPLAWAISYGNADSRQTYRNLYQDAVKGDIGNIGEYYRYSLSYKCTDRLKRIKAPVLIICGSKDKSFRKYAKIIQLQLPQAQTQIIPGMKHQIPTKAALVMNEMMRKWIKERQKTAGPEAVQAENRPEPNLFVPPAAEIDNADDAVSNPVFNKF